MNIPRAVLELHRFASTDTIKPKPNIHRVHCERDATDKNTYIAVATDGHRLGMVRWQVSAGDDKLPETFALDASACKTILKGATKGSFYTVTDIADGKATLHGFTSGAESSCKSSTCIDDIFPPWRKTTPPQNAVGAIGVGTIGLNAEYFADVTIFLKKCGVTQFAVRFDLPSDALSPVRIEYAGDEWTFIYVLMPTRL